MINLKHLKSCPAIIDQSHVPESGALYFCIDTRNFIEPGAFVAIPGAKINPLLILSELLARECPLVFYQGNDENCLVAKQLGAQYPKTHFIPVKDSITFLQELTKAHTLEWKKNSSKNIIFGISGSNGKTTHKEMLAHILNKIKPGKIVATDKNNNNHLGVPLTLLNVSEETEFVVLELGSNHPGEIKTLCDIAKPNAGVTTNIGATHLEFFGSEDKVFQEEGYLYHAINMETSGTGFFLINKDDIFLRNLAATGGSLTYGVEGDVEAKIEYMDNGAKISYQNLELMVVNKNITGKHNKLNLITCAFIAYSFYPECRNEIIAAAANFRPTNNRSEWVEFEQRPVFLDAYNANPSSMKAALLGFKESALQQGFKLSDSCVVLGDMNELGENASQYHEDVGKFVAELGFSNVFFIGQYADFYLNGFPQGHKRKSILEFKPEYRKECIKKYSIHFIKGSRSLQLESLFVIT
jgi:UDP-N-acetylmuramoyl-tripeptide--D-alanyl-D-alanine ligase